VVLAKVSYTFKTTTQNAGPYMLKKQCCYNLRSLHSCHVVIVTSKKLKKYIHEKASNAMTFIEIFMKTLMMMMMMMIAASHFLQNNNTC
jgi:hypothetical protein